MTNQLKKRTAKTYIPTDQSHDELKAFLGQIEHFANKQTELISAEGTRVLLPEPLFDVLRRVADSLAAGNGVTIMPQATMLTTQQAADLLGTSRPTLIRLLEANEIDYEMVGRHRRVKLGDLNNYQERAKAQRRALLRRTAREGQEAGMLDITHTDMPPRK